MSTPTNYVIGVDMGTQGVRGIAVTSDGTVLARASVPLPPHTLAPAAEGIFEQDAQDWWRVTYVVLGQLGEQLAAANIPVEAGIALCISGTSGTFVPLDAAHHPLRPALMYSDSRAVDEAARCNEALAALTQRMGYRFNASFALPKLLWLATHEPHTWARTALVAHQADYLVGQLTDVWGISDYANVLKTGYDLLDERYPDAIAQVLNLSLECFPRAVTSATPLGCLLPSLASALRLRPQLLVVAGTTDGCASQFAAGAIEPGEWVSSLGTTLTIKGVSTQLITDVQGRVYCHRHPGQGWLPGGASNTGGEVLARRFPAADLTAYDKRAAQLVPTALLSYPLVRRGERFPFVAPQAEGFVIGLGSEAEAAVQADMSYAAALEGVALLERLAYDVLTDLGATVSGPIRTVGGATRSSLWLSIRASVCNRPFTVPLVSEPAMGAAVLAASARLHPDVYHATRAMIRSSLEVLPEPSWVQVYQERYASFKEELHKRGYI
ncbi:MAG: FGGY-family carbohydrate kinase [Ktedonobacteraceae bacterium]|nr:FGGY-family carbohydrate kinase [Ktedonobacteraceae bacterium]